MRALPIAILILALAPASLAETVYRWVGPDGTVHYSGTPPPRSAKQAQELVSTPGTIYTEKGPKGVPDFTDQRAAPYKPESVEASGPAPSASTRHPSPTPHPVSASAMLAPLILAPLSKALGAALHHLLWLLVIALLVSAFKGLTPRLKGMAGEGLVRRRLQLAGIPALHDAILPDGQGELTQIDHLALMPWGIAVIETKYREGRIFGKAGDTQWTYRIKRRTYRFQNPLRQNHKHVLAVQALVPAVATEGLVVFTGGCEFPNGMPRGVTGERGLLPALQRTGHGLPNERTLRTAWATLTAAARTDRASRKQHLKTLHGRFGGGLREPLAYAILILAAGIAVWQWVT